MITHNERHYLRLTSTCRKDKGKKEEDYVIVKSLFYRVELPNNFLYKS